MGRRWIVPFYGVWIRSCYPSTLSTSLTARHAVDPVQGLILSGGRVADGFEVGEDRGAGAGGAGGLLSCLISSRKKCPRQP